MTKYRKNTFNEWIEIGKQFHSLEQEFNRLMDLCQGTIPKTHYDWLGLHKKILLVKSQLEDEFNNDHSCRNHAIDTFTDIFYGKHLEEEKKKYV